jgi:riboflavin synthase
MFTGIIEHTGTVTRFDKGSAKNDTLVLGVPAPLRGLKTGASLAVNGACLTVAGRSAGQLHFHLLKETRRRTAFGDLRPGDPVNLERPLKASSRLDGHFVLGHVDGTGRIVRVSSSGADRSFLIEYPAPFKRWLVEKGSVAVDGISLTLGKIAKKGFWVHCIPHTVRSTRLRELAVGRKVNLEGDILAKLLFQGRLNQLTSRKPAYKLVFSK